MSIFEHISKAETRTVMAIFWSLFAASYITGVTFFPVPETAVRVVDTALGFVLGTIVPTIVYFYFGSSKGSADKSKRLESKG